MTTDVDRKVAYSLLDEVATRIEHELGNQIALPTSAEYDAHRALFCESMVAQCELAERKASDDEGVLLKSSVLLAQLYGNWQKPQGVRGTQKRAIEYYERALGLVGDREFEASIRYRYALMCRVAVAGVGGGREKAVENFERVVEIMGVDSELGLECAKEAEKEKAAKGKGCFIATAVYGSPLAPEVSLLSRFRDDVLEKSAIGRAFTRLYYLSSPPLARIVSSSPAAKAIVRALILRPVIHCLRR